ncbi:stage III sporulation protein AE [Calidifontibacillus erzurumensis]|uniref:Stage III sporulation protein AE n=1 Tax=Calidifontibacillus erzurumensis TaxID=2741433 RepID=A0A8J8GBZ9_9BACI|nr:stage III sporulation protein AE [Calidifontibacillus erzurumensis]NSL50381.1 stage III sporulation protein AE [Calidifontibacillus erzurumensis]
MVLVFYLSLIISVWLPINVQASPADPAQTFIDSELEKLGVDQVKQFWEQIVHEYGGFLPESQKGTFMEFVKGDKQFSAREWINGILKFILYELLANGKLLGTLIMLTIFSLILQSIQNAFDHQSVSKIANAIVYIVLMILALNSFHLAISYAESAIENMMNFMIALLPLLLGLIASIGSLASVAFFHPIILFLVHTSGLIINKITLPLLFLATVLSIVSTMTDHYKVTQLAGLLRNIAIWILGAFLTIFLGVISVQGAAVSVSDGLTVRTAKFITNNIVPVFGRTLSDAADTVLSASVLLKNTIGLVGVAILLILAVFPAIKVLLLAFIYKAAAALLEPLGGGAVIQCLDIISKSVIYVFAALAIVSIMFFLAITVIVSAGNIAMMMR